MEKYFIFLFYRWRIYYFSHFFDIEDIKDIEDIQGKIFYLSICPGDSMDNIPFYPWRNILFFYFIHGEYGRYPILSMENMDDILFYRWRNILFFYFILFYPRKDIIIFSISKKKYLFFSFFRYRRYRGYRRYPRRNIIISYSIHKDYGRYPILSICPGDSMDDIGIYNEDNKDF